MTAYFGSICNGEPTGTGGLRIKMHPLFPKVSYQYQFTIHIPLLVSLITCNWTVQVQKKAIAIECNIIVIHKKSFPKTQESQSNEANNFRTQKFKQISTNQNYS